MESMHRQKIQFSGENSKLVSKKKWSVGIRGNEYRLYIKWKDVNLTVEVQQEWMNKEVEHSDLQVLTKPKQNLAIKRDFVSST